MLVLDQMDDSAALLSSFFFFCCVNEVYLWMHAEHSKIMARHLFSLLRLEVVPLAESLYPIVVGGLFLSCLGLSVRPLF